MPKERNFNPVQAQRKAEKAKAIKKGKADVQSRRNEQLARKNPERIQKQINDLKAITEGGAGKLTRHEEQVLEGLEKELKSINKAREALGDKAPTFGRGGGGGGWTGNRDGGVLGKRRRDGERREEDWSSGDDDVAEEVRRIPMPRDTPPPIPKEVLDKWYAKRRAQREAENATRRQNDGDDHGDRDGKRTEPAKKVESKTVYEAAPVTRNLRKEAVSAFVPTSVKMKMDKGKGQGGLMEPEEADKLEKEGYLQLGNEEDESRGEKATAETSQSQPPSQSHPRTVSMEEVEDEDA